MGSAPKPKPRLRLVLRIAVLVGVGALGVSGAAGSAANITFVPRLPAQAFEGQKLTISVFVHPSSPLCTLAIRYKGGRTDRRKRGATTGRVSWTFRVPAVPPGTAAVTVSCQKVGSVSKQMLVQWALQAPKLSVGDRGYRQRNTFGNKSDVSYGLALRNERVRFDAVDVSVLVNFVDATNRVLGSAHATVRRLPADSTFYVGGKQSIPTQTRATRLEVVITAAKSAQRELSVPPLISDVQIRPDSFYPTYVGSVVGQLLNHYPTRMKSVEIGIALVDAAGHIIGGGRAHAQGPLSLGAREFFTASFSFTPVPRSEATAALVSPVPAYETGS